ncbi:VOC family protein [Streptomyces sp. NPDC006368]|uniref:VOC family protein n=1 Tax=Streptomyces sp. NPDC006368 TaxID=3156760 RepID=UPI0033B821B3
MLTTEYVPGAPNWIDLGAPDVDAAVAFYSAVFGWTFQSAGQDAGGYGFLQLDGRTVGAVGPLMQEGTPSAWTTYFMTTDADATLDAVRQAGGSVRAEPMDVFTAGRSAAFTDPTGADFAVWQPGDITGLDLVMEPNALCWTELATTDAAAAKDFYRAVFSWEYQDMDMSGDAVYSVVSAPDRGAEADPGQGGIIRLSKENVLAGATSEWHPYFGVLDCDAVFGGATGLGATPVMPPTGVPGVGRIALLKDPAGALFALIKGDPSTT